MAVREAGVGVDASREAREEVRVQLSPDNGGVLDQHEAERALW